MDMFSDDCKVMILKMKFMNLIVLLKKNIEDDVQVFVFLKI